jgi:hypothetical protein
VCNYATDPAPGSSAASGSGRISKPSLAGSGKLTKGGDVQARLDRLEMLLEQAVSVKTSKPPPSGRNGEEIGKHDLESKFSPSSNSQASQNAGISCDNNDGTLLLDGEESQFVSSLHYALLAEEVSGVAFALL